MERDWDAEWVDLDAEFQAAKKARDAAHEPVSPELGNTTKAVSTKDLAAFGEANKRFKEVEVRRKTFLTERKAQDPRWGGPA